jgi:hypothetical protein
MTDTQDKFCVLLAFDMSGREEQIDYGRFCCLKVVLVMIFSQYINGKKQLPTRTEPMV